jgi:hypothetical protein
VPSLLELARLSSAAYSIKPMCHGWRTAQAYNLDSSYFAAALFKSEERDDWVLAYRGTDALADLIDDALIGLGAVTTQSFAAERTLSKALILSSPGKLTLTGHSLGGGLASLIACRHRLPCVTFNAPGMARSLVSSYSSWVSGWIALARTDTSRMLNIRTAGDMVSLATGPGIGRVSKVPNRGCAWMLVEREHGGAGGGPPGYLKCTHEIENMVWTLAEMPVAARQLAW